MPPELNTRQTLMEKIRSCNDDKSWEEYAHYYRGYILALLRGMGLNHHDQEDLLQQVLLKSWKSLPQTQITGRFRSWLLVVTRNTARDHFKSKQSRHRKQEVELNSSYINFHNMSEPEIEKIADEEWMLYISKLAWENISKDFKSTLLEAFLRSSDDEEISTISQDLGISESSIYVYKQRVQKALMKEVLRLEAYLA
jgi:RNA polymerase sigma factor (sigma-70 family)